MKAICFTRVSSVAQDLTAQKEAVVQAITKDGFDEIIFIEGKESAIKLAEGERVTLNELKVILKAHPDCHDVFFYALDRLARRVSIILSVVDQMNERGVCLHFLNPYPMQTLRDGREDALGKMFLTFLAIGAELEMQMKNERFAAAREVMKANGQLLNGKVYYGYKRRPDGYAEIDEQNAEIVRRIFRQYLEPQATLLTVAKQLVTEGIWKPATRPVLSNKVGIIIRRLAYSRGNKCYTPIVPVEVQDEAIAKLQTANGRERSSRTRTWLLKGRIYLLDEGKLYPFVTCCRENSYRVNTKDYNVQAKGKYYEIAQSAVEAMALDAAKAFETIYIRDERWRRPVAIKEEIQQLRQRQQPILEQLEGLKSERSSALKRALLHRLDDADIEAIGSTFDDQIGILNGELVKLVGEVESLESTLAALEEGKEIGSYENLSLEGKESLIKRALERLILRRTDRWEWTVMAEPALDLKIGVASPEYTYSFKGGRVKCWKRVGSREMEFNLSK